MKSTILLFDCGCSWISDWIDYNFGDWMKILSFVFLLTFCLFAQRWGGNSNGWGGENPAWGGNVVDDSYDPIDANVILYFVAADCVETSGSTVTAWKDKINEVPVVVADAPTLVDDVKILFNSALSNYVTISQTNYDPYEPGTGDYSIDVAFEVLSIGTGWQAFPIHPAEVDNANAKGIAPRLLNDDIVTLVGDGSGTYWVNHTSDSVKVFSELLVYSISLDRDGDQVIFFNGDEIFSQTVSNSVDLEFVNDFQIGRTRFGLFGSTQYYNGYVYEIRISNIPRSATEVSDYYDYIQGRYAP